MGTVANVAGRVLTERKKIKVLASSIHAHIRLALDINRVSILATLAARATRSSSTTQRSIVHTACSRTDHSITHTPHDGGHQCSPQLSPLLTTPTRDPPAHLVPQPTTNIPPRPHQRQHTLQQQTTTIKRRLGLHHHDNRPAQPPRLQRVPPPRTTDFHPLLWLRTDPGPYPL